jgi:hypothetical protein
VRLFARIESEIPKDRSEIPPSVRLFAKTKYQMIDPKYLRRCACSQKRNTKWSIRNTFVGAHVRKNEISNDRSKIWEVETELGKSERRKSSCWVKDQRHCSQIQIKNEATGSKTGGAEIWTDHHARTKTSDRRVTAEEKQLGQAAIEKKSAEQTGRGNWSEPSPSRPATQENWRGKTKLPTQIQKYSTRVSKQGNRSPDQQHKMQNLKFSINFRKVHNWSTKVAPSLFWLELESKHGTLLTSELENVNGKWQSAPTL